MRVLILLIVGPEPILRPKPIVGPEPIVGPKPAKPVRYQYHYQYHNYQGNEHHELKARDTAKTAMCIAVVTCNAMHA